MDTKILKDEQAHRRRLVADSRAALKSGKSTSAFLAARAASIAEWITTIRTMMDERGAADPAEILPELVVHLKEALVAEARAAARVAAQDEVRALLRKAIAP
jgi:hypothetical protein